MARIPFSEFTEAEERVIISALQKYIDGMDKSARIYDTCINLIGEMTYHLRSRMGSKIPECDCETQDGFHSLTCSQTMYFRGVK